MRTPFDPENPLPHLFLAHNQLIGLHQHFSWWRDAFVRYWRIRLSVDIIFTSYRDHVTSTMLLTLQTEDGQSSLIGSVENSIRNCIWYSRSPALHDLSWGSSLSLFSSRLHLIPICLLWIPPIHFTGHSNLLHALSVFIGKRGLTFVRTSRYFRPDIMSVCLWKPVTQCDTVRFSRFHLKEVLWGSLSYILRTGTGRTDGRDVHGVMR